MLVVVGLFTIGELQMTRSSKDEENKLYWLCSFMHLLVAIHFEASVVVVEPE